MKQTNKCTHAHTHTHTNMLAFSLSNQVHKYNTKKKIVIKEEPWCNGKKQGKAAYNPCREQGKKLCP